MLERYFRRGEARAQNLVDQAPPRRAADDGPHGSLIPEQWRSADELRTTRSNAESDRESSLQAVPIHRLSLRGI